MTPLSATDGATVAVSYLKPHRSHPEPNKRREERTGAKRRRAGRLAGLWCHRSGLLDPPDSALLALGGTGWLNVPRKLRRPGCGAWGNPA